MARLTVWNVDHYEAEVDGVIHRGSITDALGELEDVMMTLSALGVSSNKTDGCKICNDSSNDRYYKNQKYTFCPHCGSLIKYEEDRNGTD